MPKKKRNGKIKTKDEYTKTDWIDWLWPVFSKFIRVRDCIKTTGSPLHGRCITCDKTYPIKKLQSGHFIPGRTDALLFDEEQNNAQCYRCNMKLQGMWHKYYLAMLDRGYTHDDIQEMIEHSNDPVEFTREWFENAYEYYEQEIERMLEEYRC